MKTAEEFVEELQDRYNIGTFSLFCDGPPDFDSAEEEDLIKFIKQIQLDAYKQGMTDAAHLVQSTVIERDETTAHIDPDDTLFFQVCDTFERAILTARDRDNKTTI